MSDTAAHSALSRMNLREQAIEPTYIGFASDMAKMAQTDPVAAQEKFMTQMRGDLCEAYGFARSDQRKPFAFSQGVAIIPVHGTLINRFGQCYGYVTGYNFIQAQHMAAVLDPDVTHIVHDHNSYGGEAAGCFECSDMIYKTRDAKPILAVVDSNCYSASFALATAAHRIVVIPSAGVGSVGVVAMHVDVSELMSKMGIKVTFIHSGDHKVDGNPFTALSPSVKANIQKGVDKSRAKFVSVVARNLGIDEKIVYDTQAATYRAEDALALGLIHSIAVPSEALQSLIDGDDEQEQEPAGETAELSTIIEDENMTTPAQAPAPAAAAPAAAAPAPAPAAAAPAAAAPEATERARIQGILGSEEAKERGALANHLAFNTSMSADDAKALLAVSGKDTPAAAAAPVLTPAAAAPSALELAMNNTAQPNLNANEGGGAAAPGGNPDKAAAILGDFERMTGHKLTEK